MYREVVKPLTDFIIASIILVLLFPILAIITLILFFSNNGKPFFLQKRPGKDGQIFTIIKFRTMNDKKDENDKLLPDYRRLTFFGKIVRKTSVDEIPQLINVVKGEMSLIGPRPLLPEYLSLYDNYQKRRHEVKPGITGWAQVNGRNALSWEEKFYYDVEYVDNISPNLDFKILQKTIQKVIKRHGVNANNYITMEAFKGNQL